MIKRFICLTLTLFVTLTYLTYLVYADASGLTISCISITEEDEELWGLEDKMSSFGANNRKFQRVGGKNFDINTYSYLVNGSRKYITNSTEKSSIPKTNDEVYKNRLMFLDLLKKHILYYSDGLSNSSNMAIYGINIYNDDVFCISPESVKDIGAGTKSYIVDNPFLNTLVKYYQDASNDAQKALYMSFARSAMVWRDEPKTAIDSMRILWGQETIFNMQNAYNRYHYIAGDSIQPITFPIITTKDSKNMEIESIPVEEDGVKFNIYSIDPSKAIASSKSDHWKNGVFEESTTINIVGQKLGALITNVKIEGINSYIEDGKIKFKVRCSDSISNIKLKYEINPDFLVESGKVVVAYKANNSYQNGAKVETINFILNLTIPDCEPCPTDKCPPPCSPEDCPPPPCLPEDCPPPPPSGNPKCGTGVDLQTGKDELRWYNLPTAYAETKNGSGYKESEETTEGKFVEDRAGETFEVMMGIPETEKLYINGGTSEGYMNVKYTHYSYKGTFVLKWNEDYNCSGHGDDPRKYPHKLGLKPYCLTFSHEFKFLHLDDASYRTAIKMNINNPEIYQEGTHDINITPTIPHSYKLEPNKNGLEIGGGTGLETFNHGATSSWLLTVDDPTKYVNMCKSFNSEGYYKNAAIDYGNNLVGKIFAQNDALTINIGGKEYLYAEQNLKQCLPFGNSTALISAPSPASFKPKGEVWSTLTHVPIIGYNGEPEAGSERNEAGSMGNTKPLIKENIEIVKRQVNGVYDFNKYEDENYVSFNNSKIIKGSIQPLKPDTSEMINCVGDDVVDSSHYLTGEDKIKVQYTNWQKLNGSHYAKQPDGREDEETKDNPRAYSVNPILIHNPTGSIYTWISDIEDIILQDQRILNGSDENIYDHFNIVQHPRAVDSKSPSRQYIDFDFELTFPNDSPFEKYWGDSGKQDSSKEGIEDINEINPGVRGKGYKGQPQKQVLDRSYNTPYKEEDWKISKWLNSKYVNFPYDVYYYKSNGEVGGSPAGFYNAGDWIQLYDDSYNVKINDPTKFKFHITSNQGDVADGEVLLVSENINTPESLRGKGQELYNDGEKYVNGKRNKGGTYNAIKGSKSPIMSAPHSATNLIVVDGIGRIGNSIIEDSSDPAWNEVFWETDNENKVLSQNVVNKDYGMYYNMFEQIGSTSQKYNRWGTLEWHNQLISFNLPVMNNPLKTKNKQVQKLGYENQASIQTLGTHDNKVMVYPKYKLTGNYATGNPSKDHFKFYAIDPFDSTGQLKEFYDSRTEVGKFYKPKYKYKLTHTLTDTRAKMSLVEKTSPSYKATVLEGSNKKYFVGEPSWIQIEKNLRTYIGGIKSTGFLGKDNMGNMTSSNKLEEAWMNGQKWNFRFSLPKATQIMFLNDNNEKSGLFEGRTNNQLIYTEFVYRTWGGFSEWDLSTFTNTGVTPPYPDNINNLDINKIPEGANMYEKGDNPDNQPNHPNLPHIPSVIEPDYIEDDLKKDYDNPATPEIIVDYSNPSDTDKTTIGTH